MLWAKYLWTSIHVVALGYPEVVDDRVRAHYKEFYKSIGAVLPCPKCRVGYAKNWEENPIDLFLYDRKTLFAWTVKIHNSVNKKLGKKEWSNEEAWDYFAKGHYDKKSVERTANGDKWKPIAIISIITSVILLLFFIWVIFFFSGRSGGSGGRGKR